jgi:multicomponent Na+:H+ antiporter subunit D
MTHPGLILLVTALVVSFLHGRFQRAWLLFGSASSLLAWSRLDSGSSLAIPFSGYELVLLRVDGLSLVFALVFALIALIGFVYALHDESRGERVASLVYAGSSLGVVFAGDWVTLFVFWELMAISSLFVIWQGGTEGAFRAGYRYLLVHVSGGSLLFAGVLLHLHRGGSASVGALTGGATDPLAFWLILVGVGLNAAIPPLHAWLTDAYPEASVTGSVFLSAFTTKTAVYVLVRAFPGAEALAWAGALMALYGVVYAVLENDIRRLLAYHIVSQVGYMVAGVGLGTALALDGATAHAFSHIIYKALLFMGAGAVLHATGLRKATELGGIGSQMKLVTLLYMVAAFSISGVPLFNGFISKSMVVSAAAESHLGAIELLLTLASVGTFLSVGLKLPYFTFFGESRGNEVRPVPKNMLVAMSAAAFLCLLYGLAPGLLYRILPLGSEYHPFTLDHVVSAIQLLVGTAMAFQLLLPKLAPKPYQSLDTDWFYRRPLAFTVSTAVEGTSALGRSIHSGTRTLVGMASGYFSPAGDPRSIDYDPNRFRFPIGLTVFWTTLYFAIIAIAAFFSL